MRGKARGWVVLAVSLLVLAVGGVAATLYITWPNNALGVYLHERRNRQANIRALEWRISVESEPLSRAFYQAWLEEERGKLDEAIRGYQALRNGAPVGSPIHLRTSMRLGLAYGLNGEPERELATYRELIDQYPGPSRLGQATFHLRRGEKDAARTILDEALSRDEKDGSLGSDRQLAKFLRAGLDSGQKEGPSSSQ